MSKKTDAAMRRCTSVAYCQVLEDRIEGDANARRKGMVLMVAMNLSTGDVRKVGVNYKLTPKDPGLMFNFCPFCGEAIDQGFKDQPTHKPSKIGSAS